MGRILPETLPIFPLSGALLLPGGQLPLNIFEPRYLKMVEGALATKNRLIGMIQPRPECAQASLFPVGCAGRIEEFSETEDGRYLITLRGQCCFRIHQEQAMQDGYRVVTPDWAGFMDDCEQD